MAITVVFDPPLPTDPPATFDSKAFTLLGDLNDFATEANALQADVNAKQGTATSAAATATTKAGEASTSAGNAASSASAAASSASAAAGSAVAADASADAAAASAAAAATFDPASYVPKAGNVTMTGPLSVPSLNGGQLAGMRNKIINGSGGVNQRGLTSVADDTYFIDRFYVLTESGNVTVAQVTDPESGASFGFRLTQPDATAKRIGFATIIESKDIRQYASQAMNFFCRVKLSASTGIRYAIIEHTGTADVVTSDVVNNWASTTFTPSNFFIAGINILKTGVVTPGAATFGDIDDWAALGASVKNVILFVWSESTLAQNGTLEANRVQYEPGVVVTPFEWRHNELALCQRYFFKTFDQAVAPASGAGLQGALFATHTAAGGFRTTLTFPVEMRASPTLVSYNPGAAGAAWRSVITGTAFAASASIGVGTRQTDIGSASSTAGVDIYAIHITASVEL